MITQINPNGHYIYSDSSYYICNDADEYNNILITEKERIKIRSNILERFEHWELNGVTNDEWINQLRRILLSRCRNDQEEILVISYIKCLKEAV